MIVMIDVEAKNDVVVFYICSMIECENEDEISIAELIYSKLKLTSPFSQYDHWDF